MTLAPVFYIMKVYNLSFLVLGGIYLNIQQVYAVYFSPTGHTKNLVCRLAADLAKALQVPLKTVSFDLPAEREGENRFSASDLVVVGGPTYAGKLPNKIMPTYREALFGAGTPAVPMKRTWPTWRAFPDRSYKPFKGKTVLRDLWPSTATPKRPITFPKGKTESRPNS